MEDFPKRDLREFKSLRDPCPYYRYGWCHAPCLKFPTSKYVNPERCETIMHKTCQFYKKSKGGKP